MNFCRNFVVGFDGHIYDARTYQQLDKTVVDSSGIIHVTVPKNY